MVSNLGIPEYNKTNLLAKKILRSHKTENKFKFIPMFLISKKVW